jgi:AraC-like DNA-binding protein
VTSFQIAVAGFAAISAILLLFAYAAFIRVPGKTWISVASCAALVAALTVLELGHLQWLLGGDAPLTHIAYRVALFVAPSAFYFFGRWAILPVESFRPIALLNLLPITLMLMPRLDIALPILFAFGAGFSIWLGHVVYGLRAQRKQFRFEFFYFVVMAVLAIGVLTLGFLLPAMEPRWFYLFYNDAIAIGIAIMLVALVANPNLIGDLADAARARYGASTLKDVNVDAALKKLGELMSTGKAWQNEALTLSSLAAEMGLSGHQLSELVNSRLGTGFSRYVRERRVEAAKALLVDAPAQSVLSVGLDTGFRSQSAFYAAFKEITGQSPGDFRDARLRKDQTGAR